MNDFDRYPQNPLLAPRAPGLPAKIAIIGAGTIGPDIGYYLKSSIPGLQLVLVDVAEAPLQKARARFEEYAAKGLKKGKLTEAQAAGVTQNLITSVDDQAIAGCDWVLEAATENLELKRKIFTRVEALVSPQALITSNTSSLPAARLFSHLAHRGRCTVTHFFAPAFANPAVEVISWREVAPATIDSLRAIFALTGKVPLLADDAICFMLDRVFDNWCNEAVNLLERGTAAQVDAVAKRWVHAGPFQVLNLAHGNPIIVETNTLQMEEGAHYRPAPLLRSVETWALPKPGTAVAVPEPERAAIADRLLGVLFSQSVDIIERGIGAPADLELGCTLALGFKRGPFEVMRELGEAEVKRILARFTSERPGMPAPARSFEEHQRFLRSVLVDTVDGVKVLTLRKPQALNALDDRMTDELLSVIEQYERDPSVRGFVIVGYGPKAFCAGADIERFPAVLAKKDAAAQYARDCSRLLVRLDRAKKPVVAALNGMALGGGFELAMRCHALLAVKDAFFQLPEVTLGIAPGIGGMVVPYRRWPNAAAVFHDMLRLGKKLTAVEAHRLGVVEALADDTAGLIRAAVARVKQLGASVPRIPETAAVLSELPRVDPTTGKLPLSREVVRLIEQAIIGASKAPTLGEALEVGYLAFGESACTRAAAEGIAAFLEGRKPDFAATG